MKAPIIILFSMWFITLLYTAYKHGQTKVDQKYNVFSTIVDIALHIWLLWWAGLFDN
jgi:hypothetical protein